MPVERLTREERRITRWHSWDPQGRYVKRVYWRCLGCGTEHGLRRDARKCCPAPETDATDGA